MRIKKLETWDEMSRRHDRQWFGLAVFMTLGGLVTLVVELTAFGWAAVPTMPALVVWVLGFGAGAYHIRPTKGARADWESNPDSSDHGTDRR